MSRAAKRDPKAKRKAKTDAPWNPEWGFCKGFPNHAFDQDKTTFTLATSNGTSAYVGMFKCINCKTTRRTVLVKGEAAVHSYQPPPGYRGNPQGDDGHMLPRRTIRDNYVRDHAVKPTRNQKG